MKKIVLFNIILAWVGMAAVVRGQSYNVVAQSGAKQTFEGFGVSETEGYSLGSIPASARSQMANSVFNGLGTRILRMWVNGSPGVSEASMKSSFYSSYADSGAIVDVEARGVTILLLAPARGESEPTDSLSSYASRLAQFIADVKTERGVVINVTGVANEPQNWTPAEIATTVDYLRTDLDNLGLTNVQIIAPESASADSGCDAKLDGMYNDNICWNAISGIASHSYNMAATGNESSRTHGKQYWITEASDDGNELPDNANFAATISARFLNDMNHLVTHWVFFIGFDYSSNIQSDNDTATKLLVYNGASSSVSTNLKYFYFQQLLATFDVKAVFRSCVSSSEGDMAYTYGQKPRINAAVALNPDGTWGIGVVNDTGIGSSSISSWYGAQNTNVTITVNELVGTGNKNFTLYYSQSGQHFVNGGTVIMTNGIIKVPVAAKELVSLRSAPDGAPIAPSSLTATAISSNQINLSWSDNSTNETGFRIQRKIGVDGTYSQIAAVNSNIVAYSDTNLMPGTTYYYLIAATNALASSPSSNEASATTLGHGNGSLSGSVTSISSSYNLTALGTFDWAHWNGAFIHKSSGGTQINNVSQIGGGTYGTYFDASRKISWTDGTPIGSGTGDTNYIWCNGAANSGWTFSVPADTTSRALHVICGGAAGATMKITAHLSDGSAMDYSDTESSATTFTKEYTITYNAASASQTLTITVIHTNPGSPSSDLIAAWLTTGEAPLINITPDIINNSVTVSWPTSFSGATLESSDSLNPANWSIVTNATTIIGSSNTVILPMVSAGTSYFRLHK